MNQRTGNEADANTFDMKLFALIQIARKRSTKADLSFSQQLLWGEVCAKLQMARPPVRTMMRKSDREATQ